MSWLASIGVSIAIFFTTLAVGVLGLFTPAHTLPALNAVSVGTSSAPSLPAPTIATPRQLNSAPQPANQPVAATSSAPALWHSVSPAAAEQNVGYALQNNLIVYFGGIDAGGNIVNRLINTDPRSFVVSAIDQDFGKDATHVYYDGQPIANANPTSVVVLDPPYDDGQHDGAYAKDNMAAYYEDGATSGTIAPIQGADVASFVSLGFGYAKDYSHVYQFGMLLPDADPSTFSIIGLASAPAAPDALWAKDRVHVYVNGTVITHPDPDPNSIQLVLDKGGQPSGYVKDDKHVFSAYDGSLINGADPLTFTALNMWYAKDATHVYSYDCSVGEGSYSTIGTQIGDAHAASFLLVTGVSSYDASDGAHEYYKGCEVH